MSNLCVLTVISFCGANDRLLSSVASGFLAFYVGEVVELFIEMARSWQGWVLDEMHRSLFFCDIFSFRRQLFL